MHARSAPPQSASPAQNGMQVLVATEHVLPARH
jgi:hypothetical protein